MRLAAMTPQAWRNLLAVLLVSLLWFSPAIVLINTFQNWGMVGWRDFVEANFIYWDLMGAVLASTGSMFLLLWPSVVQSPPERTRTFRILTRVIDVVWHLGAIVALAIAFANLEQAHIDPISKSLVASMSKMEARFFDDYTRVSSLCQTPLPEVDPAEVSPEMRKALVLIPAFCEEQDRDAALDPAFSSIPLQQSCARFSAISEPGADGARDGSNTSGLISVPQVARTAVAIGDLCYSSGRMDDYTRAMEVASRRAQVADRFSGLGTASGYFRFVALMIGLRIFRGLCDLIDEIRFGLRSPSKRPKPGVLD